MFSNEVLRNHIGTQAQHSWSIRSSFHLYMRLCSFYIVKKLPIPPPPPLSPAHQWVKRAVKHALLSSVHVSLLRTELKSEQHEHIAGVRERPEGWVDATMWGGGCLAVLLERMESSVILRVIRLVRWAFHLNPVLMHQPICCDGAESRDYLLTQQNQGQLLSKGTKEWGSLSLAP